MNPTIGKKNSTSSHAHVEPACLRSKKMMTKAKKMLKINPTKNKIEKICE